MNYLEVAEKTAREAGVVLLENLGKVKKIEFKAKNSLVTEVDKLSEEIIINNIKKSFPSHDIFAEESGRHSENSDYLWLIDPIDGTTNYAHAYPFFSISIALEVKGEVEIGLVYDPVKDEMFTAEAGKGAYLNGELIKVSKSDSIEHSHVCTGFMHEIEWMVEANIKHFGNFIRRARAVRRDGSAALDVCYVACGRFDGFWELGLNPWDTAAAVLILKEAGGQVTTFSGDEYSIYIKEILASNSIIHGQMMEILALEG
ncbi:MAG: inositol monophosphatase [Candidatus Dadabacteria bacterium]|nr:inositol monophosphatase [Candidatus Dadabacteria bacterium]TDI90789.1 MAG: inositol monophosphatase [Candidatus Dadabacteria bacterium]TDJ02571.1 MAG: inositol monophosphatase [Candidatus Dadabacteria bacterium]